MCNKEAGLPPVAICSCGATFYDCSDDKIAAIAHIRPSGGCHEWVYLKDGFNPPNPERRTNYYQQHKYSWYYYLSAEVLFQEARMITRMSHLNESSRDYYMREYYKLAKSII